MGLFDKKKKEQSANEDSKTLALENTEITDVNEASRFAVIVEGVTPMLDGDGFVISGDLFGKISKDDIVYVYQPGSQPVKSTILALEAKTGERSAIVDDAEDTSVSLQLNCEEKIGVRRYAVLTNLGPQEDAQAKTSVANAAVAGLINGMRKYGKDNAYHATLAYWISHSHFITPIKLDEEPEVDEKGFARIKKDAKIGFYMLKSTAKLPGTPEGQESMVIPLFTDWPSLRNWKTLAKEGQKVHTQIISFQQLFMMLKKGNAYAGIAIDPFNKVPCTLPIPYLETITNTPGYQKEFGPKPQEQKEQQA